MQKVQIDPLFIDDAHQCFTLGYHTAQLEIARQMLTTNKFDIVDICSFTHIPSNELKQLVTDNSYKT